MNEFFLRGYMEKSAGVKTDWTLAQLAALGSFGADRTSALVSALWDKSKALGIFLPILLGASSGVLASRLTSPSKTDLKNLEKGILLAELAKAKSELKRHAEVVDPVAKQNRSLRENEREIRIS